MAKAALLAAAAALLIHKKHGQAWKTLIAAVGTYGAFRILLAFSRSNLGLKREKSPQELWAGRREEDAVEPELRIFDCHHHLWDFRVQDKPPGPGAPQWLLKVIAHLHPEVVNGMFAADKKMSLVFGKRLPFAAAYMTPDLIEDIRGKQFGGHNVVGTMYMECGWKTPGVEPCMEPAGEVDMVQVEHGRHPSVLQAMVGYADLNLGREVEPLLKKYQGNPFVKGIRHSLWYTNDPDLNVNGHANKETAKSAKFREAFGLLRQHNLVYDSWVSHENLEDLADLAKSFPDQPIVCDHIGFPLGIGTYKLEESTPVWKQRLAALAEHKNVYVKIGGIGMTILGFDFADRVSPPSSDELADRWGPYVRYVIEKFGADRCMMESNFPMDKVTCSYTILFNALKKIVKDHPQGDKVKMFETNALRLYNVTLAGV